MGRLWTLDDFKERYRTDEVRYVDEVSVLLVTVICYFSKTNFFEFKKKIHQFEKDQTFVLKKTLAAFIYQ